MIETQEKIESMVIGAVIGDALGVPVEFLQRDMLIFDPVTDLKGYGTHQQPLGTWSDDTSLTLAFIDAITHEDGWNVWNFANNACDWYHAKNYTPHGKVFDIGITTSNSLEKFSRGIFHPSSCGGCEEKNNGNGALMRIHPLIVIFLRDNLDLNKRFELIKEASSLTHNHNISHIACFFYTQFLCYLINNDKKDAYTLALSDLSLLLNDKSNLKEDAIHMNRIIQGVETLSDEEIMSYGYVIFTLEASLWCLLTTNSYEEAVLKAVNLGEDSDTVCSVTGAMAGLYYGIESIPNKWIDKIVKIDTIKNYSYNLSKILK